MIIIARYLFPKGFDVLPLVEESRKLSVLTNPNYEYASRNNVSNKFFNEVEMRTKTRQNFIISVIGPPGSHKSWSGAYILQYAYKYGFGKPFPEDWFNVEFNTSKMLDTISKAYQNKTISQSIWMLDEHPKEHGPGSHRQMEELRDIEEICRKAQVCFIHCAPSVRTSTNHYILETWAFNKKTNQNMLIVYDEKQQMLGYVVTGLPKMMEVYERKKDDNIDKILARRGSGRPDAWTNIAQKLTEDEVYSKCKNNIQRKIRTIELFPNLTNQELQIVMEKAKMISEQTSE